MQSIEQLIKDGVIKALKSLYHIEPDASTIQINKTKKEFIGDFTLVVFPLLKLSGKSPELTANEIGKWLVDNLQELESYNVIKGFLNLVVNASYFIEFFNQAAGNTTFGFASQNASSKKVMVEYSSPNTNKPLHLGHIRNNLLGFAVANILKANGHEVKKVNLVNDRGIHICKSMLAWKKFGNGETPASTGIKGDHLVGDYYVRFDKEYKKQIAELMASNNMNEDAAKKEAPLIKEAQDMLRLWEAGDKEVVELWKAMNGWVYKGFDETYKKMGVDFDRIYYESETYLLGKEIVQEGLSKSVFFKKEDASVWIDLTADGLDQKLLLRGDGTSVYMTQDLGTAVQRCEEYHIDELIYVVGNEQNYHFQVLSKVLEKLGHTWAKNLFHLSYGMVELPEGKMKSREGTVVDADDLIDGMVKTAEDMSVELGKLEGFSDTEKEAIYKAVGLGALKYFILKVDPKKTMTFDPKESIDFNGNTGPFIQYTYARIRSLISKSELNNVFGDKVSMTLHLEQKEKELIKIIYQFPEVIAEAGKDKSPALLANYCYELVKEYNQFYHDFTILKEEDAAKRTFRIQLSAMIADIIERGMNLLGIAMPQRM